MYVTRIFLTLTVLLIFSACSRGGDDDSLPTTVLEVSGGCNAAAGECVATGPGLTLALTLGPGVKPLVPFPIRVTAGGSGAGSLKEIRVEFDMRGMDMGQNRYRLERSGLRWDGAGVLPICTSGRAEWLATVTASAQGRNYRAVFPFVTTMR